MANTLLFTPSSKRLVDDGVVEFAFGIFALAVTTCIYVHPVLLYFGDFESKKSAGECFGVKWDNTVVLPFILTYNSLVYFD
jgi:hypothetical protein